MISSKMEYAINENVIRISQQQLVQINENLTQWIKNGLFTTEEAAAYTKVVNSIFNLAAGAAVENNIQTEMRIIASMRDEIDTILYWNVGRPT